MSRFQRFLGRVEGGRIYHRRRRTLRRFRLRRPELDELPVLFKKLDVDLRGRRSENFLATRKIWK
jgi:hypothetical protein